MSDKKDYLDYIENVLGVRSVLLDEMAPAEVFAVPLLIAVENYRGYQPAEKELLGKMVAALKIDLNKIQICDLNEVSAYKPEFTIFFRENADAPSADRTLTTYAPRVLLAKPNLKKTAWDDLQPAIYFFQNRIS